MTTRLPLLFVLALALGACSRSLAPPAGAAVTRASQPLLAARSADLRLLGVNTAAYDSVFLEVKDVTVLADGAPLAVTPGRRLLDVADGTQSWLVGTVTLPAGATQVDVTLTFDDFGGFAAGPRHGNVDARAPALHFLASADQMATLGKAEVQLDLGSSLGVTASDGLVLLPNFTVDF